MKKVILLSISLLLSISVFSQKKGWLQEDVRNKKWPRDIYYKQYASAETKSKALDLAKIELSRSIFTEVSSKNTFKSVTKDAVYNEIFKESASTESSLSISGLEERVTKYKKKFHVLIYIKKEDFKAHTKTKYDDLLNTIIGDVNACQRMYSDNSIKGAKTKGDEIQIDKKKLRRLKNLLTVFDISHDVRRFNDVIETFDPLYEKIKKRISDEENYKYNKDQGELKAMSNDSKELEEALLFYTKAQKIDPKLALEDEIPAAINQIKDELYKLFCQKAYNFELEKNYSSAVYYYKKARDIYPKKKVAGERYTTTEKVIECQNLEIDLTVDEGKEELKDNPAIALSKFTSAKAMAGKMGRTERIKPLNRLIKKAERKIWITKVRGLRSKSSKRILLTVGGGIQTDYSPYQDVYTQAINVDLKNWNLNATLGYRMNLPDIAEKAKTGREISRGNVLALFFKKGSTNLSLDTEPASLIENINFTELELGYVIQEFLRLSGGIGNRSIPENYQESIQSSYYTATAGVTFHLGRLSTDITATYLFNDEFEPEKAKLGANIGLRYYFWPKIYKETKKKL